MVTFAIIGSSFDPTSPEDSYVTMRQVSLTLMISRVVLIVQYGVVMLWVKNHRRLVIPLLIHIATFAVGAILCFKLLFSFTARSAGKAYFVWYVIIVMEALAVFLSSSQWRSLSFAHTNLNERCGLLTLIILGEGIIVLTKSVGLVVKGENFSSGIIAQIISAILIIVSRPRLPADRNQVQQLTSNLSISSTCSTSTKAPTLLLPPSCTTCGPSSTSPSTPPSSSSWKAPRASSPGVTPCKSSFQSPELLF